MINLNDLRVLKAIADKGSFNGAAAVLDMPTSTVSRRVSELEKSLQVTLVQRTSRIVSLTEAGQLLNQQASPHLQGLLDSVDFLQEQGGHIRGKMTIVAPIFLSYFRLSSWIAEFQGLHPDLEIEFRISNKLEDVFGDQIDLAIRPGPLKDSSLIAKKLYETKMNLFASPRWLKSNKLPKHPSQLNQVSALTIPYLAKDWRVYKDGQSDVISTNYRIFSNDFGPLAEALIHGNSIAVLPQVFGEEFVKQGKLVKLLPDYQVETPGPIYAVYPSQRDKSRKTQALISFLEKKFKDL
ncbi:LysR family transcriptional regulator [Vibrio nigripulchritudo]|uniref:LysR family transcriptional regulator n=1 Tax=Vibrio nigripulchritudo TaxID=28173 RepID=UPI0003B1902A|nr:LysR family transcriptional regulator [Vibrio nigripulchritudo]CCN69981.1 putative Transcriptional regulator, LysR family [Vibrio nigripulchritudo SFn118]